MMTADDKSHAVVVSAVQAWLLALSVARERDPYPNGVTTA